MAVWWTLDKVVLQCSIFTSNDHFSFDENEGAKLMLFSGVLTAFLSRKLALAMTDPSCGRVSTAMPFSILLSPNNLFFIMQFNHSCISSSVSALRVMLLNSVLMMNDVGSSSASLNSSMEELPRNNLCKSRPPFSSNR